MKCKVSLIASGAMILALAAIPSAQAGIGDVYASAPFQGITFTFTQTDADTLKFNIKGTLGGDWSTANYLGAFDLKDLGLDFSTTTAKMNGPGAVNLLGLNDQLSGSNVLCTGPGSPPGGICFNISPDFNVNPMCSVIAQIEDHSTPDDLLYGKRAVTVNVLDEIVLANSNTADMCHAFVSRVREWNRGLRPLALRIYGDAAGTARSTAGASDYQIIREFFRAETGFQVSYHIKSSNPLVRDRVNAVNALLCNTHQQRRLFVDPRCKRLIRDFEQVVWKADSNRNLLPQLDKANPQLTHVSDALGYLVECEFGLRTSGGPRATYVA